MGSLRFAAILFSVYSLDHPPPHVHAIYGDATVILEMLPNGGITVAERDERKARRVKRNELRRILRVARMHEAELRKLWSETHGENA